MATHVLNEPLSLPRLATATAAASARCLHTLRCLPPRPGPCRRTRAATLPQHHVTTDACATSRSRRTDRRRPHTPVPLHPPHGRSRHRTHLAQTSDTPVHSASSLPPTPPSRWLHTLAVRGSHGLPRRRAHTSRKRVAVPLARSRLHARLPKPDVAHVAAPREEHAAPVPLSRRGDVSPPRRRDFKIRIRLRTCGREPPTRGMVHFHRVKLA